MAVVRGSCKAVFGSALAWWCVAASAWAQFGQMGGMGGPPRPATVKVEKRPIATSVSLKAVVESEATAELSVRPEAFAMPLVVEKAVEHGTSVKKGDVVVELELDKVDQAIKDLKVELGQTELALRHADHELPVLERLLPMDLAAAERTRARAAEDLARFLESDKPLALMGVEFSDKSAEYYLESARDELSQLEKMYRAKDLTEETEQLILKRQRFQVEMALFRLKTQKQESEQTVKVTLPRRELTAHEEADRAAVALEKAKGLLPLEISQKRVARDKLAYDLEKGQDRLARLERDRKAMTVRAPMDGLVYYGKATRGQWPAVSSVAPRLARGGMLQPSEVFLTIVDPRPAFLRATVEEKDLDMIKLGAEGVATPVGAPQSKLAANVAWVEPVPVAPGSFEARVKLSVPAPAKLVPGMAASIKLVTYKKDDALTLPESAVFSDGDDSHYVYLPPYGGKPGKKAVTVGKTAGGRVEILEGLKEGDEILASKP